MGTKNDPGKFDCYAKLDPDEPYFVIRAKDPIGAMIVDHWADIREAMQIAEGIVSDDLTVVNPKIQEAYNCAASMRGWRLRHIAKAKSD